MKTLSQQMKNLAVSGTGLSQWEAGVLVDTIEEVCFGDPDIREARQGQLKHSCVAASEPPGRAVAECKMTTVILTLFDDSDRQGLGADGKDASVELRRRRLLRITEEAREQDGLLSQEDLAWLLMCDVRTIRRDIADLKEAGIIVPTRGTIRDIGPGVTHRAMAVRLWIEGKEPGEVARHIKHSLKAVESYLEKFKRVVYLLRKGFTSFETARTVGISTAATAIYTELYGKVKNTGLFAARMEEIDICGAQSYQAQDEKKESPMSRPSTRGGRGRR
jgi:DNA-binding transcriptional regulator YhcF (GntR family)